MDWRLKALAFRVLELPGGEQAHYFLQRHVTRTWPRPAANLVSLQNIPPTSTAWRGSTLSSMRRGESSPAISRSKAGTIWNALASPTVRRMTSRKLT